MSVGMTSLTRSPAEDSVIGVDVADSSVGVRLANSSVGVGLADSSVGVGLADSAPDLRVIRQTGCAAAIWRRRPAPALQRWMDGLPPSALPRARIILRPAEVREAALEVCNAAGIEQGDGPHGVGRDLFLDDIASLASTFAEIMQTAWLRMRLDVITNNACRKFHIDAITARLICTYRGTGTQYGVSTNGADPDRIFTVPTGAPIVLRGTRWTDATRSGLLHRSPPIEGTGETRSVLVLDPVSDPDREF